MASMTVLVEDMAIFWRLFPRSFFVISDELVKGSVTHVCLDPETYTCATEGSLSDALKIDAKTCHPSTRQMSVDAANLEESAPHKTWHNFKLIPVCRAVPAGTVSRQSVCGVGQENSENTVAPLRQAASRR